MQPHYFIAVPLPKQMKDYIMAQASQVEDFSFKRWVHTDDLHITLVFLGSCEETVLQRLIHELTKVVRRFNPFSLTLSSFGTFGLKEKPRVLWLGVEQQPALFRYQQELFHLCERNGFTLDKRPYTPHITLARKWDGKREFVPVMSSVKGSWEVDKITLYQSLVTNEPKYHPVQTFPLGEK